jgi:hypothetical protein
MVKIELRSIKVTQAQSRETFCYTAKLYADGAYIADISNSGGGGADRTDRMAPGLSHSAIGDLDKRVRSEHPKEDLFGDGQMHERTLEGVCHELVGDFLTARDVARMTKSKVVFFEQGLPADGTTAPLFTIKVDTARGDTVDAAVARLRAREPKAYILNGLPEADAIAAYKRAA